MTSSTAAGWLAPTGPSNIPHEDETIPVFARWFGSWQLSLRRRALSAPQLVRSYDRAAPGWGRKLERLGVPDAYEALLRGVLSEEAPDATGTPLRVLDGGVGTGALSCALARALPGPFTLDAIDISPRMLERAGQRLRDAGVTVSLRQGDVRRLPYGTGVFDLVMTGHVLEHLVDPGAALREMARVLKPGGLLIACLTRRSPLGMYVHLKWRTHRVTPAEAERWLRESGLGNARCRSFGRRSICQRLSVACLGRKPISVDFMP